MDLLKSSPGGGGGGGGSPGGANNSVQINNAGSFNGVLLSDAQLLVGTAGAPQAVTVSGDATLADTGAITLANTIVAAGPVGDSTHVAQITFDAKGRLTAVSSVAIAGGTPSGPAGGDLTGTYPNPTIKASVGLTGTPTAPTQAAGDNTTAIATDAFVTTAVANAIAGVNPAVAVQAATTAAGNTSSFTYSNGVGGVGATFTGSVNTAVTIDGFTFSALGQRLLVKNDTQAPSGAFNGVYYVTQLQTAILPPILTRALDYDTPSDINNTGAIPVVNGTVNASTSWLLTSTVNTVGTDPLTYTQFSINPTTIVTGPASAVSGNIATYNGTSGKVIQDGGVNVSNIRLSPGYTASGTPWYLPVMWGAIGAASGATVHTQTYLTLIFIPKKVTISSLAARVTTQGSSNFQLGIYNINPSTPNRAGTLVDHTGSISNNVVAGTNVSGALGGNQQLEGFYFAAIQVGSAGADDGTVRHAALQSNITNQTMVGPALLGSTTLGSVLASANSTAISGLSATQTFGTWGDLTAATFTELTTSLGPALAMQIASFP